MNKFLSKLKHIHPLLAIAAAFFILAGATFVLPQSKTSNVKGTQTVVNKQEVKPTLTPIKAIESNSKVLDKQTSTLTTTPQKSSNSNQNSTSQSNQNSNPQPTTAPVQNIQVALSINGSSVGQVTVANGQNQCDVLSNALSQGKISQLNMQWVNSLGTYGVYQING